MCIVAPDGLWQHRVRFTPRAQQGVPSRMWWELAERDLQGW